MDDESEDIPFLRQFSERTQVVCEMIIPLFVCEASCTENHHYNILKIYDKIQLKSIESVFNESKLKKFWRCSLLVILIQKKRMRNDSKGWPVTIHKFWAAMQPPKHFTTLGWSNVLKTKLDQ